ncbi:amidohydrolase family protein [Sphingomonas sp. LR61]|uniref:amidohydrolase family protein n=1 Tax=Sphingomonas sp. LR61 TaxID=3050234 RepID=UPI002FDFA1EE
MSAAHPSDSHPSTARPTAAHPRADHSVVVHSARVVVPMTAPPIADGAVAVQDGRILHVGDRSWVVDQLTGSGATFTERQWRGALLPGLVNAHSHLQYTGMASVGRGQYDGFEDWASAFNQDYAEPHDWRAEAAAGAAASIRAGVTSIADIVTDIEASTALEDAGLGGIAYWEVMDWENDAWQSHGRDQVLDELARIPTNPGAGLSPHAPYSLEVAPSSNSPTSSGSVGSACTCTSARPPSRVSASPSDRSPDSTASTASATATTGTWRTCPRSGRSGHSGSGRAPPRSSTGSGCSARTATSRTACT